MQNIPDTFNNKHRRFIWEYRDAKGDLLGCVARFDDGLKKDIVPYFKRINGHTLGAGSAPEPRPLFGLDVLVKAEPGRSVFVVEGEKAAAALQSLGLVAVTSIGGSKAAEKTDWAPLNGRERVYLLPDNDEPGEQYIKTVAGILAGMDKPPASFVTRLPGLPEAGDVVDWVAARVDEVLLDWDKFQPVPESGIDVKGLLSNFKQVLQANSEPVPAEWMAASETTGWQAPIELDSSQLPEWPDDIFQDSMKNFVNGLAAATETPPELPAMMALAVVSASCQSKYCVRVKSDYFEPVNIWPCVALPSGNRKTAILKEVCSPLYKWEKSKREELELEIKKAQSDDATMRERIRHLRAQASKAKAAEFEQLKAEIADLEASLPEIPTPPQLWAQDVTPENLGTIMSDNDERMAILSDEGGIFDILAGRYSGGVPNLDLFLQAHAGSAVRVNRGSRPPVFMQAPALTLGLSPQPDLLRGLTENKGFRGRGLLARFLYVLPKSNLGHRSLNVDSMMPDYRLRYEGIITAILNHERAGGKDDPRPHVLKLSVDASRDWKVFALKIEAGMREGEAFEHVRDWASKLPGAVARIAGLLHVVRHAFGNPESVEIGQEDMSAAVRLGDVLSAHALAAFDLMGADPAIDGARLVLRWIKREGKSTFTFRDCYYANKSRFKRAGDLEPAIDILIERHFIRRRIEKVAHRPSRLFEVNPEVLAGLHCE